ncbi:MAG: hypothetical protein ACRD8W_00690 [Nitrososphaeraceae archaeon]
MVELYYLHEAKFKLIHGLNGDRSTFYASSKPAAGLGIESISEVEDRIDHISSELQNNLNKMKTNNEKGLKDRNIRFISLSE